MKTPFSTKEDRTLKITTSNSEIKYTLKQNTELTECKTSRIKRRENIKCNDRRIFIITKKRKDIDDHNCLERGFYNQGLKYVNDESVINQLFTMKALIRPENIKKLAL